MSVGLSEHDIEAPTVDIAQVEQKDLFNALHFIFAVFIDFFMHDIIVGGVPNFHIKIWNLMTRIDLKRVAICAPRGHAKTTLAKLVCIWYFLFTPTRFIVYLSNTADLAVKAAEDIIEFLETMNFVRVFGAPIFEVNKRGEGEYIFTINTPDGKVKRCILKARGANQQVRGLNIKNLRPQVAVVDDLEDIDDIDNELTRKKTARWFFGTFIKALDRHVNKVIMIGNLTDNECLLNKVIKLSNWHSMILGAITKEGTPLWPEMWPLQALIDDYQEYVKMGLSGLWFAEMMNIIIAGEDAIIRPEEILYLEQPDTAEINYGFITIDPATGIGKDNTAIVVHLLRTTDTDNLLPQIVDYRFGKIDEEATVDEAISLAFQWGVNIIAIEAVAYQRALATLFEVTLAFKGLTNFTILKTYPANVSKTARILSFAALLKTKAYALTVGDVSLTAQLIQYDRQKRENDDDIADSAAQGPEILKNYLGLILSKTLNPTLLVKVTRQSELC